MARNITVIATKKNSAETNGMRNQVRKLRVAAYCRVSTDQEEQLLSYEIKYGFIRRVLTVIQNMNVLGYMRTIEKYLITIF